MPRRTTRVILILILAALAAPLGACTPDHQSDDMLPGRTNLLDPAPAGYIPATYKGNLFELKVFYLIDRVGPRDAPLDLLTMADETVIGPSLQSRLTANGLRLAAGGQIARETLDQALARHPDITVTPLAPVYAYEGYALDVPYGVRNQDTAVMYVQDDGALAGQEFADAVTWLRFQCSVGEGAASINVVVSPWIQHGEAVSRYRPSPGGWIMSKARPRFWFHGLKAELEITEGQIVMLGRAPGRPMSLGDVMLLRHEEPYRYVTTIVLAPRLLAPSAVPASRAIVGTPPAADRPAADPDNEPQAE